MNWLQDLLTNPNSIAHIVALYAFVIAAGVLLGKIKFFGISLGVTFVLFVGILAGHFGFTGNPAILSFVQDFGLILFVFCIGLQVGPSFFSSFKRGGITLNLLAVGIVFLNIAVALILYFALQGRVDIPMMVGILCGAVTNTPGLGAANEALQQLHYQGPEIAMGYACAYPLGVMGIILSMIIIRYICRVDVQRDSDEIQKEEEANPHMKPYTISLKVQNEALSGKTLSQVQNFLARDFVCTRIIQDGHMITPNANTVLRLGDRMFLVCAEDDSEAIMAFIGPKIEQDWDATNQQDKPMVSRRILVTQPNINGKTLGELHFSSMYGVNVTRVNRSGMDLFAARQLRLQVGDRVMVVGPQDAIERVANLLGNQLRRLDHPNIVTIFVGILCGILFGSLPIAIPGMPTPVKLGLAGGPLIISILIGEGGSGGALALATADRVWMLQNAVYSVISPEGCASILWKDSAKAETAAASLRLTAEDAKSLGVIERILSENDIGKKEFYDRIRTLLTEEIKELSGDIDLTQNRYDRFRNLGVSAVIKE